MTVYDMQLHNIAAVTFEWSRELNLSIKNSHFRNITGTYSAFSVLRWKSKVKEW